MGPTKAGGSRLGVPPSRGHNEATVRQPKPTPLEPKRLTRHNVAMSGGVETAGDITTGALVGRAIEPRAGEAQGEAPGAAHGLCLNCGTALIGKHCHACGQGAHVHRTVGAIGHDIAHSVFHFEGKVWRTLPLLTFRPGELTRRYVAGERARFVSPLAMFLFSVFLMFAVVANLPGWSFDDAEFLKPGVAAGMAKARTELAEAKKGAQASLAEARESLARERADTPPDPARIARLEKRVAGAAKEVADITTAEATLPAATTFNVEDAPPSDPDNWLEAKFRQATDNPKFLIYKIKTSAYKFSWALIPISLPFVWLLFPLRRDVGLYDHAVFATYSLTFMSLLVIALASLGAIGVPAPALWTAAVFIPPVHIYKQLKGAYGLTRLGGLWRTFWMLTFAAFTSMFFVLLLLYLGIAD